MKVEIDTQDKVLSWLQDPTPAVFQGQDLRPHAAKFKEIDLVGCVFLGCRMDEAQRHAAALADCLIIPVGKGLPFDPFAPGLYTPDDLFDQLDPADPSSYEACLDRKIYVSVVNPTTKDELPVDIDIELMRRIHDFSISEALDDFLRARDRTKAVAIMGGHDRGRSEPIYRQIAEVAQELASRGYLVVTGGGPGLMEAANLGAYTAGFEDPKTMLDQVIEHIAGADIYNHPNWLSVGYTAWKAMGPPKNPVVSCSLGIPTWFYGHEPPNVFATHIAKYFENSVREEGLLGIACGGVIFAEGNGGTVQEIFQDACQNYYRTYGKSKSPMILFGSSYWNPDEMNYEDPNDRRKKIYPALLKLATEKDFADYLFLTDDPAEIVPFLEAHPPA